MDILKINCEKVCAYLVSFLKEEVSKIGFNSVIFGLSGGLDSSLVAFLCKMAFGRNNTYGIILPYKDTPKESVDHAYLIGRTLGIRHLRFNITPQIDYYYKNFPQATKLRKGNKMARERMSILYDLSSHFKSLVVGTSNKSEIYLGYGTLHGDTAYDINPVADLYKTQIYQLSEYLKIPEEIRIKKPSAELWEGQTDEEELGFSYEVADKVLFYYFEKNMKQQDIMKEIKIDERTFLKIIERVKKYEFKRKPPLMAKIPDEIKY